MPANHPDVVTVSAIADKDGKCGGLGTSIWVDAGNMSGLAEDDTFAPSAIMADAIDIAAPGVKIKSTYPMGHMLSLEAQASGSSCLRNCGIV